MDGNDFDFTGLAARDDYRGKQPAELSETLEKIKKMLTEWIVDTNEPPS